MGLNITGVAINKKITTVSELESFLRLQMTFDKEIVFEEARSARYKNEDECDVFYNDNSTTIFFSSPQELRNIGYSFDNCQITTFTSSETAMYFRLDVYKNMQNIRSLRENEGDRSKDEGDKFENELANDDGSEVIYKAISNTINEDFWEIDLGTKCHRYKWSHK